MICASPRAGLGPFDGNAGVAAPAVVPLVNQAPAGGSIATLPPSLDQFRPARCRGIRLVWHSRL